jgi:N-acetylmuramoyl-L-alanine amidase
MTTYVSYDQAFFGSDLIVGIDPGHGGIIHGKYTTKGKMFEHPGFTFYEGVFNRAVALHLADILVSNGISHYFTTDTNEDISLPLRATRVNNFSMVYPDHKHLLLSLHGNAAGIEEASGIEVCTTPGITDADKYATPIHTSLKGMGWKMRSDYSDGDPDKEERFYMLTQVIPPAVLIESGFFTNLAQAKEMMKPAIQKKLAELIYKGVKNVKL